jgi:hypothetical protein
MLLPDASPRIVSVQLSNQTVHSGDTVSGIVITSSNVASVEARVANFSIGVPKVGVGRFSLDYVVPFVPFFFHGKYDLTLIARDTAGHKTTRKIPLKLE